MARGGLLWGTDHTNTYTMWVLSSSGERRAWSCSGFDELNEHHFNQLFGAESELVIFGSGARLRFLSIPLCIFDQPPHWNGNHGHGCGVPYHNILAQKAGKWLPHCGLERCQSINGR